jgi:transposase|tara:strand:+ start:165 stop:854 length:690 start_codon:yes stop_codon:yes gene_type:complete
MEQYGEEQFAGLDVSLKTVSICVCDARGAVLWRGEVVNEPAVVAAILKRRAPGLVRAVLETGSCGIHLYRGLAAAGVPIVCICARHAKGVLACKVNKSDANDAEGLAQLAFVSAIDGEARFAKSSSVGAYLGLTPRGHQSGEVAWSGRISKAGDGIARALLYEAANSLMVRVKAKAPPKTWPPLKVWAHKLAARVGGKKARVALARKMAVILHRMLSDNTPCRWRLSST